MKKLVLLCCIICLTTNFSVQAHPTTRLHDEICELVLHQLYIPPRLIDADSVLLEIHFSINERAEMVATRIIGGDPLLRRFVLQQIQTIQTTIDVSTGCNQQFVLPLKIRK